MASASATEFSFADGGALIGLLRRAGVLRKDQPTLSHRVLVSVALTWIPLLILSALNGEAVGQKVKVPFLWDLVQHARFLVAIPLAFWAEGFISRRFPIILSRFLGANLVSGEEIPAFEAAIARARWLKNWAPAELILILLAYAYLLLGFERNLPSTLSTWDSGGAVHLWYRWISLPIFTFVWLRWLWRQAIWAYLLSRISRLKLRLLATHPDRAGGLAFVNMGQRRFAVLMFAFSAIISASMGEEMLFAGASLRAFEPELAAFFVIGVLIILGPLLCFTSPMYETRLRDLGRYGLLAARYTQSFDEKWIEGKGAVGESPLGSQDIQSLADLINSYDGVSQMRAILPDRKSVIALGVAFAIPLLPLLATVVPWKDILSTLLKILSG